MFKNYKSKKQLRQEIAELEKENAKLHGMLQMPKTEFVRIERNIQKVQVKVAIEEHAPAELIKERAGHRMVDELLKFIHWDIVDSRDFPMKMLVGYMYVDFGDK